MSGWRNTTNGRRRARCTGCHKDRMCNDQGKCLSCCDGQLTARDPESPGTLDPALWVNDRNGIKTYTGALR